jgi:hypothetical protein
MGGQSFGSRAFSEKLRPDENKVLLGSGSVTHRKKQRKCWKTKDRKKGVGDITVTNKSKKNLSMDVSSPLNSGPIKAQNKPPRDCETQNKGNLIGATIK